MPKLCQRCKRKIPPPRPTVHVGTGPQKAPLAHGPAPFNIDGWMVSKQSKCSSLTCPCLFLSAPPTSTPSSSFTHPPAECRRLSTRQAKPPTASHPNVVVVCQPGKQNPHCHHPNVCRCLPTNQASKQPSTPSLIIPLPARLNPYPPPYHPPPPPPPQYCHCHCHCHFHCHCPRHYHHPPPKKKKPPPPTG